MKRARRKLGAWADRLVVALWWLALAGCALPLAWLMVRTVWHDGQWDGAAWTAAAADAGRWAVLLGHSALALGGTLAVALPLGLPLGFLCARTDLPGRRLVLGGCVVAACLPLYVTLAAWMARLGSAYWLTLPTLLAKALGVAWLQGLAYLPHTVLISAVAFAAVPRELEEAAQLEASARTVAWRVTLPLAGWGVGAAALVIAALALADITVTDVLVVRTFAEEVFTQLQTHGQPGPATITALPAMLLLGGALALVARLLRHHGPALATAAPRRWRLGRWRLPALAYALLVALLVLHPLASLVATVGNLDNLRKGLTAVREAAWLTAWLSPLVAAGATGLAAGWAWCLVHGGRWRHLGAGLLLLLLATPAPLIGIALIELCNRPGLLGALYESPLILLLGQTMRVAPLATLALLPTVRQLPAELLEAARLEGAGTRHLVRHLLLPLAWRGLLLAFTLAAILAVGELGASVLLYPPGQITMTVRFFSLIHYGLYPDAAVLCLLLLALLALPALALAALVAPALRRRGL
jgi:iron(III) transport system permease protein